ncbi:D-alanyl-D-alanine carboxypeptidase [Weissella oryzae SG25]|uniref:D-alanyl-D-alanine carboxypeptidase n=1 Tax=Weissella oryzae (strain DSM 25784 / JCM 18191 / LMG 30913 / SG25) TaxID=1329250 RepID=A0A069CTJ5_WEIOS|nr:serine hydrolase [Weissella oryzae]GAK31145.1 D-alanyl-D-alanine carboxypeptidase [Weissella oryzae SG25]
MIKLFKNKFMLILISLVVVLGTSSNISAALFKADIQSAAGLVIDAQSGQVILSKNDQQRLPIASLSKLIVIYMTEQKLTSQKLSHTQMVTVSADIAKFSQDNSVANVAMTSHRTYTINDLEQAALLPSSNAAAMALADFVAGSQENYYQAASKLLSRWGINDVKLYTASGLPSGNLENQLSAREVAQVALHLVNDYPDILKITKKQTATFPGTTGQAVTLTNTNKLLNHANGYNFSGLKTGTTANNGSNFAGYATVNGRPVITVTLNAPGEANFSDTLKMLDTVANKTAVTNLTSSTTLTIPNAKTTKGQVTAVAKEPFPVFYDKDGEEPRLSTKIKAVKPTFKAPIKQGTTLAQQKIFFTNPIQNDYLTTQNNIKYIAPKNIEATNFIVSWFRRLFN